MSLEAGGNSGNMSASNSNITFNLDWSDFIKQLNISGNESGDKGSENSSNYSELKPEKIVAIILSVIGVLANFTSIIAITRVRGRLTSNLR